MKFNIFSKSGMAIMLICALFACRKKYDYEFKDGFPGPGYDSTHISVDTSMSFVDRSKYNQARVFPGLVGDVEPRLKNYGVTLNLNYHYVSENLRIQVPPQAQFSTGLYAPTGELIAIDVPQGINQLVVQIGAWTDNLTSLGSSARRDPLIYSKAALVPGRNYIRNLYGGPIYIFALVPVANPVTLNFTGAVKMPDFVLGQTADADWVQALAKSTVPWLEFRAPNIIFTLPKEGFLKLPVTEPTKLMQQWDNVMLMDYYQWEGLLQNPGNPVDQAPLLPWRCIMDINPSVGYAHSGWPCVMQMDDNWFADWMDYKNVSNGWSWGTFHELGHNNQQVNYWSWAALGETSNNLFSFKVAHRQSLTNPNAWPPNHPALPVEFPRALAYAARTGVVKNFDADTMASSPGNSAFFRIVPFVQMFEKISYDFMPYLYGKARRATRPSYTDLDKKDFLYEAISDYTGQDWKLFFNAWGIQLSSQMMQSINAKGYPTMNQKIWEFNPLNKTGGNAMLDPYNNTGWSIIAFSSQEDGGADNGEGPFPDGWAAATIDGDITTYWHSNYSGSDDGAFPPHFITYDVRSTVPVKAFTFVQRQGGSRNIKNVKIEISNDNNAWQNLGTFGLQKVNTLQTVSLLSTVSFRYFRITVPTQSDVFDGTQYASLAEVGIVKP